MFQQQIRRVLTFSTILLTLSLITPLAWGQHGSEGRVNVTVVDPQGAVVTGADLTLIDIATNDARKATTSDRGTYAFVNLDIGTYKLTVTKTGFASQTLENVVVQATKTTDISVRMAIGAQIQQVQVEAVAPVVETSTNVISTVIDPKQIESLPITGRDLTQLSRLTPGYNGTWNGLPTSAQGNNIDGIVGSPSRMKFGGNSGAVVSPRLENIEEMAVQNDQLDLNQGFGQAAMQINYVTRRGSNAFHGRIYEDFRNAWLNANSWSNNARGVKRPALIRNEFGGSVGGPIIKDKLFFFVSISTLRQPGAGIGSATVLTPSAQAGNFTYRGSDGLNHTVNVLTAATAYNATLPNTVNSVIATQLTAINGSLASGSVTSSTDPNINNLTFLATAPTTAWYPTLRLDYNTSRNVRMDLAINRTTSTQPGANLPFFPGSGFKSTGTGNRSDNATVSYGVDWTVTPTLINQFKAGWLYNTTFFSYNTNHAYVQNPINVSWSPSSSLGLTSPQNYNLPITPYYPVFNISDTMNWQKGAHNWSFGFSWIREQDHYWNPPEGIAYTSLGLVPGDPALDALTNAGAYQPLPAANSTQQSEAQNLYALLTGRVSNVLERYAIDPKTGKYQYKVAAYNLDELAKAWGLFAQDSWRIRPSLTINYGLRWDFTGDNYDLGGAYHNADITSLYGPTAPQNLFQPGQLGGNMSPTIQVRPHAYNSWNVSPQPVLGFAWSPHREAGILGGILGKDATVIRAGYSLRRFTVPYQYFWDNASNYGTFFYQFGTLTATNTPGTGNFAPGSVALGSTFPTQVLSPTSYQASLPASAFTFIGGSPGLNGFKYNIGQPYTETWTVGIQRSLGSSRVLEVRYNGNRTLKQWININPNEVNVFENGFLKEFIAAQNNLKINGGGNFANLNPAGGTVPLPIITAAITGSTTGAQTSKQFSSGTFITALNTGAVGDFARRLSANSAVPYFCNLVGAAFTPCATNAGYTGAGAGFPINFFVANPYAVTGTTATGIGFMTDAGSSSYNALQVDFRQRPWHGVQFDANYTWSKTLGMLPGNSGNDWTGAYTGFTLRNLHASYVPAAFDLHHVVHVNATADLPFGKGKRWANSNAVIDRIVGGWNLGTIMTIQSGYPFRVLGGFLTYNNIADGGVALNGVTRDQLQAAVGVHRIPGATFVTLIDPKYINLSGTSASGANTAYITGNTTPGVFAPPVWLYGPHGFFQDLMITKNVPVTERVRFNLQGEFLNAWNHPVFGQGTNPIGSNVRSSNWGITTGSSTGPRNIELRANVIF
jgi:hypothetical protein